MNGPLHGLKVLEFAGIGPVPFAGMLLADLGASVVRIERPRYANPTPGYVAEADPLSRGRRSLGLDLKAVNALTVLERLLPTMDVVLDPFRPGVLSRLGVESRIRAEPRLILARSTGWGTGGTLDQEPGHDINYIGLTGALSSIGRPGQAPSIPLNLVGDYAGGSLMLLVGILAALQDRQGTGRGGIVDSSILDGTLTLMTLFYGYQGMGIWNPERGTNLIDSGAPFYDCYECSDGGYMAVGAVEAEYYSQLLTGLELDSDSLPPQMDRSGWSEIRKAIASRFLSRTRDEWSATFERMGACCTPVLTLEEAPFHPHNAQRGLFREFHGVLQPRPAFGTTEAPSPPPVQGQHTREVLRELDFTGEQIEELMTSGTAWM